MASYETSSAASAAKTNSYSKQTSSSPFEWLSGGLFFGVGGNKSKGGSLEGIDTSKDPLSLLTGVQKNLNTILSLQQQQSQQQAAESAAEDGGNNSNIIINNKAVAIVEEDSNDENINPSKFIAARLSRLRFLLYDERRITSSPDSRNNRNSNNNTSTPAVAAATLQSLTSENLNDLMPRLIENLSALPFESRKHVAAVFNYMLVCGLDGTDADMYKPVMMNYCTYVESIYDRIMSVIVKGHEAIGDIALHFGSMYRSCLMHPSLYRQLVGTTERAQQYVFPFMDTYVNLPNFDVSSDAMESLRLVILAGADTIQDEQSQQRMAEIASQFLIRDYDAIWDERFNPKLLSDTASYMTRRVALQILSGVLLTRSNYAVMIKYVNSRSNLILVMHLLRDTSPHITLDAFHVFKVFVANPNKTPEITKILQDNKVKLCRYLATLHQDKEETDTQFRDEKGLIIQTIEAL